MKALKNIGVGFLVSYIGSIPLGYLNIIGFDLYTKMGNAALVEYLLGVVIIEAVVIYLTLLFANRLIQNARLLWFIELFSIAFLLLLAWSFYSGSKAEATERHLLSGYADYAPFWIGIIFSSLNFIQLPFWAGWNLYLINARYISPQGSLKFFYLAGTLAGTFFGMLSLVLFLDLITDSTGFLSRYLMAYIIPLFFLGMALYQSFKFYRKNYARKKP